MMWEYIPAIYTWILNISIETVPNKKTLHNSELFYNTNQQIVDISYHL